MSRGVIIAGAGRGMLFAKLIASGNPESRMKNIQNCVDWMQLCAGGRSRPFDRTVAAMVDCNVGAHERIRRELDECGLRDCAVYGSLEEALDAVPESMADAVMVVTPNATHADLTCLALSRHRHVFLEKPVAASWDDVLRIRRAADASPDRTVLPGFVLRYSSFYQRVKEICDSGIMGNIVMIQANERLDMSQGSSYRRGWRRKKAATGGSLNEKCSHDLDILCWLKERQGTPTAVFSAGDRELFPYRDGPDRCPDCSDRNCPFRLTPDKLRQAKGSFKRDLQLADRCIFRTDADVRTNQSVTVLFSDGSQALFTMMMYSGKPGRDILIHGTTAMLEGDFESGRLILTNYRTGEAIDRSSKISDWHGGGDFLVLNDFFDCIDRGCKPIARLADGIEATTLALAADRSGDEGRMVNLSEFSVPAPDTAGK